MPVSETFRDALLQSNYKPFHQQQRRKGKKHESRSLKGRITFGNEKASPLRYAIEIGVSKKRIEGRE